MDGRFIGKACNGTVVADMKAAEKRGLEWDLDDWMWDGFHLTATPLITGTSDCRSRQLFLNEPELTENGACCSKNPSSTSAKLDEVNGNKGKREAEKRSRVVPDGGGELCKEAELLNFNLGGQVYPIMDLEANNGKKIKVSNGDVAMPSNRVICQVEDCKADLSNATDYHRRHKVCKIHSKANEALVRNVRQRFCQQCSRFHLLEEFDEGKRSCRTSLAVHNKRRRKTHPDNIVAEGSLLDERSSSYLLASILKILSNMHANNTGPAKDGDLLSNLLKNLVSETGSSGRISAENLHKVTNMASGSEAAVPSGSNYHDLNRLVDNSGSLPASNPLSAMPIQARSNDLVNTTETEATVREIKMNNIDLNHVYIDSQDHGENMETSHEPSPTQTIGKSDSMSSQSPLSSGGEAQSCTDRIVFKLFGKHPGEIPVVLRKQILDWLSRSPTDIEGYIRPGCIVLTVYLRLGRSEWHELCLDLGFKLRKLLEVYDDSFWRTGWVYTRVQNRFAFIYNGQVVLDLPIESQKNCRISSIRPVAVSASEKVQFVVKGFNLCRPATRLLCALEGKYLTQEIPFSLMNGNDAFIEHDDLHCLSFSCSIPSVSGRGFIEIEDDGLSNSFFPFIVAEEEVCSEIRMLEGTIETVETANDIDNTSEKTKAKKQAMDFIHEMGWLLHRSQSKFQLSRSHPKSNNLFPLTRFKRLIEFSLDHNWCSVVKKLLDILFTGTVDSGEYGSLKLALTDMGLLHSAVSRNHRPLVELLLRYVPDRHLGKPEPNPKNNAIEASNNFIFKPDIPGPAGLTPLHVAAKKAGSEDVLDALTSDPGMVGIEAWMSAIDSTGLTPKDYACLRGYHSYINLVQTKINTKNSKSKTEHVVLDINPKTLDPKTAKVTSFHTEIVIQSRCKVCHEHSGLDYYGKTRKGSLVVYRPVMLSMASIAAVCVFVALIFKSLPHVGDVRAFSWDVLKYGSS